MDRKKSVIGFLNEEENVSYFGSWFYDVIKFFSNYVYLIF